MKNLLFTLLFIVLIAPDFLLAAPYMPAGQIDLFNQTGIQLSDVEMLKEGQSAFGIVKKTQILAGLGIKNSKVGDKVQLTMLKGNKLKISIIRLKQEQIIQLKQ